jgi:hypothetical protein
MKAPRVTFLLLFFLLSETQSFSQDTNIVKYFPLKVGNSWVYESRYIQFPTGNVVRYRITVTGSLIANGRRYFTLSFSSNGCASYYWHNPYSYAPLRVDSMSGNVCAYTPGQGCSYSPDEKIIDSLAAKLNDSLVLLCGIHRHICQDTALQMIFGALRSTKFFFSLNFELNLDRRYVKGIGISHIYGSTPFSSCTHTLLGCIIDGLLYGDTTLTGVMPISNEVPTQYNLYQNYPNPFNPSTRIQFAVLPSEGDRGMMVRLVIYDILGREVATLVNESLKPGVYEVEWSASGGAMNYPSGVYYYKLTAGDYTQTKKMVLLK